MNAKLVSVLLVCSVLFGGAAAGTPTTDQHNPPTALSVNQTEANGTEANAVFVSEQLDVRHGGTATIPVHLTGTDTATVRVGSEDVNYAVLVTVTDGDGDDDVTVRFDTDAVAEPNETLVTTADASDEATVKSVVEEHLDGDAPHPPLDPADYPLALFVGDVTEEERTDTATMRIRESATTTDPTTTDEPETTFETTNPMQSTTETTTVVSDPEPGIPGFGVGAAVAALAGAALLATRR